MFPVVFAERLDPASGPGLMFVTLPLAFARMPLGTPAAVAFFVLLTMAALASAISLLEMPVALAGRWLGWSRPRAAALARRRRAGPSAWPRSSRSTRGRAGIRSPGCPALATATAFECLDHLTSNVLLPLGGLGLALFGGWVMPRRVLVEELRLGPSVARVVVVALRYVVPVGIVAASLASLAR